MPDHFRPCTETVFLSLFDDPDEEERTLYIQYWQAKLKTNPKISFPDSLVKEVAAQTDKFSFAYLKEALYVCRPSPSYLFFYLTDSTSFSQRLDARAHGWLRGR